MRLLVSVAAVWIAGGVVFIGRLEDRGSQVLAAFVWVIVGVAGWLLWAFWSVS